MENYLIVIEKTSTGYSAFSPDVNGCITVGNTIEETTAHMREAIELYLETLAEIGDEFPSAKGLEYHIQNNLLKAHEIAGEYYLAQIEIHLPAMTM